jgi:hypothetical protein
MKTILISLAALTFASGAAFAAPGHGYGHGNRGGISPSERAAIARSAVQVAQVKRVALRDGRVSMIERMQIRRAEARHSALVARAQRS